MYENQGFIWYILALDTEITLKMRELNMTESENRKPEQLSYFCQGPW